MLKRATVLLVSLTLAGGVAVATGPLAAADTSVNGTYNAIAAKRIVDTRSGVGARKAAIPARGTLTFQAVTPLGATAASAVALMITAITPARDGYLVAYSGLTRPSTSTINFAAGQIVPNSAVVAVDATGTVSIYNGSPGTLNVAVDATGYWTAGDVDEGTAGALHTVTPARLYDTRTGENTALSGSSDRTVTVAGVDGVPESGASAVVLNATAITPAIGGYLSVTQQPETADSVTSSVNFTAGPSRADLVVVPLDADGAISLHNGSPQPLGVVLDVAGYISDGTPEADGSAIVSTGYRAFDDRVDSTPIQAGETRSYSLVPGDDAGSLIKAAVVTVTVATSTQPGYFVRLNGDGSSPAVSSLNHVAARPVAQTLIAPVRSDGTISLRNVSAGTANLIIDVTGFVLNDDASSSPSGARRVQTVLGQARRAATARLAR